jgi:hypothetical protein
MASLARDPLVCQELIKVLKQYNLIDDYPEYFKKRLLSKFDLLFSRGELVKEKNYRSPLGMPTSLANTN